MCPSCLMYSCLFVYGKSQMFWLAIFILGLSEGSPYIGVVGGDAYLNWTITNSPQTVIREIRNADRNLTLIIFYPDSILPSATIDKRITYTGNLSLDIVSFTLSNITQSDAGEYEFTRNSVDLGGQALVIAEIPIITGITTSFASVVAGRDQKLNCSAESKSIPPGYNLTMFSEWKRNGGNFTPGFKYNVAGTILTIINVTRAESGDRYTCRAYEHQRKKSDESGEFSLTVLYGPDNIHIIPSEVNLDEGNLLNITCFAECNPPCTSYQWQKETRFPPVGSSASYVVKEVNRTHAGVYICTVNNTAIPNSAAAKTSVRVNYGPDARSVILRPSNNSYELAESSHLSVNCSAECIPDCEYRWTGPGGSSHGNTGLLSIPQIYRNQSGVFTCIAYNPKITSNSATATISVNVLYGPDTNSFTLSPNNISYELVEYSHFTVNCSTECVPACEYRWTGPGGSSHGSTGLLSIPQIYRNQTGVFTCIAYNPRITSISATATISVNVLYGPDTNSFTLSPNNISYELAEYSHFTVNCFTKCVPACEYRWIGPGGSSHGNTGLLSIPQIYRNETGVFTCTAYNPRVTSNSATATISVIVLYGPDYLLQLIPPKTLYRLEEKMQTSDIKCFSDCFPSCNFQWTGPVSSSTGVIAIGTVERSKSGNYTCMGKNPRTQNQASSATVTFIVIYGPDTPVLTPSSIKYILNESNSLPVIRCSTDCFPGCTTYWYKEQTKLPGIKAGMLALGDVYRNDSGTYTCQSKNMESNATRDSSIQLVVQYRASITNFSAKDDNSLIKENDSLQLLCQVDSNPLSDIFLYNEDNVQLKKEENALKLNYTIKTAECLDAGNYRCRASNSIMNGDYASSNLQIMVACSPRLDYRKNVSTVYHTGLNSNVTLDVYVIAYPDPTNITWYHRENETSIWQRVNYQPTASGGLFRILIQLNSLKDFGYYMVTMMNYLGNFSNTYNIIPGNVPEVPSNITIMEVTINSVIVQWVAGYNGGTKQTFHILVSSGGLTRNVTASDPGYRNNGTVVIKDLAASTNYSISMSASNSIGTSNMTEAIFVITLEEQTETVKYIMLSIPAVAGGIGAGAVVILVVVLAILFWRRYHHSSKHSDEDLNMELEKKDKQERGLVDNPVYDSSQPLPGLSNENGAKGVEYAVVKPKKKEAQADNQSNLYAQVDKTVKKKKKDAPKGKPGKVPRGDIYENATIINRSASKSNVHKNFENVKVDYSDENVYENPGATTGKDLVTLQDVNGYMYKFS